MSTPIKSWRQQASRAAEDVAKEAGVTLAMWSRWETGARQVPAARVLDVERITGISRHELRPDVFGPAKSEEAAA
jgi:DNA-binding transcriptional regulator YdaS (Cro superfamily)